MSRVRTRVALFSATTIAATAAIASFTIGSSSASPTGFGPDQALAPTVTTTTDAKAKKGISLKGAFHDRGAVSRSELAGLKQLTMKMKYQTDGGQQQHVYKGPLLLDVLNAHEPAFSSDRHDPLRYALLFKASDGFLAALSWGEIATDLANKHVIIALTEDGKQLTRPRLVVPGDTHGARQVYDLATISLLRLTPAMANGAAGAMSEGSSDDSGHNH